MSRLSISEMNYIENCLMTIITIAQILRTRGAYFRGIVMPVIITGMFKSSDGLLILKHKEKILGRRMSIVTKNLR